MVPIERIAFIGFGEAAQSIAAGLLSETGTSLKGIAAWDLRFPEERLLARAREIGVAPSPRCGEALAGAELVISAVVASAAEAAARSAAPALRVGQIYLDINSISPASKQAVGGALPAGVAFVEAAVMAAVPPQRHKVPMLLAGPEAAALAPRLNALGMRSEAVGSRLGGASAIKMLRSVMIKGVEALLLECLEGAFRLEVDERILASVAESLPGLDWRRAADYHLGRVALHGSRRAAEMGEVAATLRELGVVPLMAEACAARLADAAARLSGGEWPGSGPESYREVLAALREAGPARRAGAAR